MRKIPLPGQVGIITGVIVLSVAIGLVIAIPSLESLTGDEHSLIGYLIDAVFILFPVILVVGLVIYYKRQADIEADLIKNGMMGVAEILSREQTGTYIDNLPQIRFHLKISLPNREAYQTEYKHVVSMLDLHSIEVGAKLVVYVDHNRPENILLTFNKVEER